MAGPDAVEVYRRLLGLLPRTFREEYGEEMLRVVAEHWAAVRTREGRWGRWRFWLRQGRALIGLAAGLRLGLGPAGTMDDDDGRTTTMTDGIRQDLAQTLRALAARPGFTAVTVLTLGLGIGASTAIFSAVHAVLFRDLPYEDPDRVVVVFHRDAATGERGNGVSSANMEDLDRLSGLLEAVAAAEPWGLDLRLDDRTETLRTWAVTERFFPAIGAEPHLGRLFHPEEYVEGGQVVLLSHASWSRRFGADPSIVGTTLDFDRLPYRVVGILPQDFKFPDAAEAWIPRIRRASDDDERAVDYMVGVARLAPGATLAQAAQEVGRLAASLEEQHPQLNAGTRFELVPIRQHLFGDVRTPLLLLLGAVGVVLLIACSNVAGLMLARGARRGHEYAVRRAMGATAGRLVRLLGVESLVLAGLGCLLGVGLTYAGVALIGSLAPDHLPRIDELRVDSAVLAFAAAAAGISALVSGLAPALQLFGTDVRGALGEGYRTSTEGRRSGGMRSRLVVAEVGAAVVLLVGAGLLFRSFATLLDQDLGFEPGNRIALQMFVYGYPDVESRNAFVRQALERIEAVPGVSGVAITSSLPAASDDGAISSIDIDLPYIVRGEAEPPRGQEPTASIIDVSPGYFDLMGIPVVAGRGFLDSDRPDAAPVVIVNEAFAERHFPGGDGVGRRIAVPWGQWMDREIVGVVRDVRPFGHESSPRPEIYRSLAQAGNASLTVVARTDVGAAGLVRDVQRAVWDVNPSQSLWGATTVEALIGERLAARRFNLTLLGAFAGVALLLAAIGIYGLMTFSVEQRIQELGIRRALGGQAGALLGMVLGEGARLAGLGIVLGVAGALVLTRFLQGMLYGVQPTDPATFVVLSAAVLAVAALAALLPAVRAMRVDPMVALRSE